MATHHGILNDRKLQDFLGWYPHLTQQHVIDHRKRFTILNNGRRWGKNELAAYLEARQLFKPNSLVWHAAPTYKIAKIGFQRIQKLLRPVIAKTNFITTIDRSDMVIETKLGSVWEAKSADNPVSLLGNAPHWITIDEAARIPEDVWNESLRPSLMDSKGQALFTSTPRGNNWFRHEYNRGQDPMYPQYASFTFSTYDNPYIDPKEIEEARRTMPEVKYRQEILAEFIDDAGAVFRNIRKCASSEVEEPQANVQYVFAADLAKHEDFTVILVGRPDNHKVIYHERFNQISWPLQKQRIIEVSRKYNNAQGIIDSTGVGDGIYDDLVRNGLILTPFKFTQSSKMQLVENLSVALDKEAIYYPEIPELINEMEVFEYTMTPGRNFKYSAPPGLHDDEVMTLALMNQKLNSSSFHFIF